MSAVNFLCSSKNPKFRGIFNGLCALILFVFFFDRSEILKNPLLKNASFVSNNNGFTFTQFTLVRRHMIEANDSLSSSSTTTVLCSGLHNHIGYADQCGFLKANPSCSPDGFFDYLTFFYCSCRDFKILGYMILGVWLVALFLSLGQHRR